MPGTPPIIGAPPIGPRIGVPIIGPAIGLGRPGIGPIVGAGPPKGVGAPGIPAGIPVSPPPKAPAPPIVGAPTRVKFSKFLGNQIKPCQVSLTFKGRSGKEMSMLPATNRRTLGNSFPVTTSPLGNRESQLRC